jgi:DNA-binding MarR family transcriptional regulator
LEISAPGDRPRPFRRLEKEDAVVPTRHGKDEIGAASGRFDPIVRSVDNWDSRGWHGGERLKAALSIVRVEQIIRRNSIEVLRPSGVSHKRHDLLTLLYFTREGQMPLGKISSHLLVHPTSVTAAVDALVKIGQVERFPHPTDRRTIFARITHDGRRAVEVSTPALAASQYGLDCLTEAEATELFRLLRKVRAAAGDLALRSPDDARRAQSGDVERADPKVGENGVAVDARDDRRTSNRSRRS